MNWMTTVHEWVWKCNTGEESVIPSHILFVLYLINEETHFWFKNNYYYTPELDENP